MTGDETVVAWEEPPPAKRPRQEEPKEAPASALKAVADVAAGAEAAAKRIKTERDEARATLEQERLECCVCLEDDARVTVCFLPCCHLCTCETCGKDLLQCPKCRTDIATRITVFA